jgi:hypothetical protein
MTPARNISRPCSSRQIRSGQAAERAEHDAGGGQDEDQGQVVAAQRERPQVDDPRHREQRKWQQRRPGRQLMRAHLAEDDQDQQDIDHVVGDAHGIWR